MTTKNELNSTDWLYDWRRRVNEASDKYGLASEARKAADKLCALLQNELLLVYRENEVAESYNDSRSETGSASHG